MTERLPFHFSLSCIGEGNGNPLQCSCLENPRDGGARWAAIYGVTQRRTQLKWLSMQAPEVFKKIFMFVDSIVIVRHMGNLTNKSLQRELTDFDVHSLPSFLNCYLKKKKKEATIYSPVTWTVLKGPIPGLLCTSVSVGVPCWEWKFVLGDKWKCNSSRVPVHSEVNVSMQLVYIQHLLVCTVYRVNLCNIINRHEFLIKQ